MEFFTKEEIAAAASSAVMPCEPVTITLGGVTKSVWVQGMSGSSRDGWEKSLVVGRGKRREVDTANVRAKLAVRCLVDKPGGTRLFTDAEASLIGSLPASVLNPIFEKAQRLSGVSDEDVEELGKVSAPEGGSDSPTN